MSDRLPSSQIMFSLLLDKTVYSMQSKMWIIYYSQLFGKREEYLHYEATGFRLQFLFRLLFEHAEWRVENVWYCIIFLV